MSMEISIDILLLSVNPIKICKVFRSNISGYKFTKKKQFSLKRFTSGKSMVFWGPFDNTMKQNVKIWIKLTDFIDICHSMVEKNTNSSIIAIEKRKNRNFVKNKLKTAIFDRFPLFQNITFGFRTCSMRLGIQKNWQPDYTMTVYLISFNHS